MPSEEPYVPPFVRELMKGSTEDQILRATENLRQYLNVMLEAGIRLEQEQQEREGSYRTASHSCRSV
jgi:hypothetical protein